MIFLNTELFGCHKLTSSPMRSDRHVLNVIPLIKNSRCTTNFIKSVDLCPSPNIQMLPPVNKTAAYSCFTYYLLSF